MIGDRQSRGNGEEVEERVRRVVMRFSSSSQSIDQLLAGPLQFAEHFPIAFSRSRRADNRGEYL